MKSIVFGRIKFILLSLLAFSLNANAQFRVVGYLPNWNNLATDAANLDWGKVTHVNIAFINPTNDAGDLGPTAGLATAVQYAHDNNRKILISLAGANINTTRWAMLQQDANRAAFITKIINFVNTYNLDGVDVDLEGSDIGANYEKFITDLSNALVPNNKLLTAAVAQWNGYAISNNALAKFDFINLMSYDVVGTWTPESPGQHSPMSKATGDLNYWHNTRGVANAKLSLGVPFYGYAFNTVPNPNQAYSWEYKAIVTAYPGAENTDQVTISPGYDIWYNGIPTIQAKTSLALSSAGGIMYWQHLQDLPTSDPRSLLRAIDDVIQTTINNTPPVVSITSPADLATFTEDQTITITADASDPDVSGAVSKVVFYAGTLKLGEDNTAPYSVDWIGAGAGTYSITAKAFDNAYGITTSTAISITVNTGTEGPLGGVAWPVPGTIQAEDYNVGGNNVSYYDNSAGNQGGVYRTGSVDIESCTDVGGGYNIGWTAYQEWLDYDINVTADGDYYFNVRAATTLPNKTFHIEMDGVDITGTITVPNTAGWQNWTYVSTSQIALTAGNKRMRFVFDNGNFNLNYVNIDVTRLAGTTNPISAFSNCKVQPNPFNNNTTINFSLKNGGETKIVVYDELGKQIALVTDEYLGAGSHEIPFNSSLLNKGFYICQIVHNDEVTVLKLIKE